MRKIIVGVLVLLVLAGGAWGVMRWLAPGGSGQRPALTEMRPLEPVTRSSRIVMPADITLSAVREMMERAPRESSGKLDMPSFPMPGASPPEIKWSLERGTFALAGGDDEITVSTSLRGGVKVTGGSGGQGGSPFSAPPGFPTFNLPGMRPPASGARDQRDQRSEDQGVDIRGNLQLSARPHLRPEWRLEPNLTSQVTIVDASLSIMGTRMNLSNEMKPAVERTINEQVSSLQSRIANDPWLEKAAREQWDKMCRSIPLGETNPGAPKLWLEVRPTRAIAAQPRIDRSAITLTFGVEAETRIVPSETRPTCSFPSQVELVDRMERGRVNLGVPIDVPFTEISRMMDQQLKDKVFPLDQNGNFTATVRGVDVAASRDRILLSMRVKANENKSWFGLGTEAMIYVWGRPVLDRAGQVLRIEDLSLDVQSEGAVSLLGVAARAALPFIEKPLKEHAVLDLKPIAAESRKNIEKALTEFHKSTPGVLADADIKDLRLDSIDFDSKTLRVIAEAEGTVRITVTELPAQ
jgi:hypothetical protein